MDDFRLPRATRLALLVSGYPMSGCAGSSRGFRGYSDSLALSFGSRSASYGER